MKFIDIKPLVHECTTWWEALVAFDARAIDINARKMTLSCFVSRDGSVTQPPQDTQERSTHFGLEQFDFEELRVISVTSLHRLSIGWCMYAGAVHHWICLKSCTIECRFLPGIHHELWLEVSACKEERSLGVCVCVCVKMTEGILMWLNRKRWIANYCTDSWFMMYDVHVYICICIFCVACAYEFTFQHKCFFFKDR